MFRRLLLFTLFPAFWLLAGCAPSIALFSPVAYERAVEIKVDALALLDQAGVPYADVQDESAALCLEIAKAREYARGLPKNELSARQWEILMNPDDELLGAFLQRWQSGVPLSLAFVTKKKLQIAAAFDTIIGLESHKLKPAALRQK